jgi:hypothetical protein
MELLDNGFDSLKKCVGLLKAAMTMSDSDQEYEFLFKDITIAFHHSTEALFKYLLMQQNPNFIYADLNNHFKLEAEKLWGKNDSKPENTIQFLDAIHGVIVTYSIPMIKETYERLKKLNEIRNDLTHYTFTFPPKETESRIALLLPDLFKIYAKLIPQFDPFAKKNHIYSDTKELTSKAEIWNLGRSSILMRKWNNAQQFYTELRQHPEKIKAVFDQKKDKVKYNVCPCCGKPLFLVTSNHIASATDIRLLGTCECCGFVLDGEDGKLISSFLATDEQITQNSLDNNIQNSLRNVLMIIDDELDGELQSILQEFKPEILASSDIQELAINLKIPYQYLVNDICDYLAKAYFDDQIYEYNDVVEQHYENNETNIDLEFCELESYIKVDDYDKTFEKYIMVSKRIRSFSEELFNILDSKVVGDYLSNPVAIYHNGDGDEIEVEFTLKVRLTDTDILTDLLDDEQPEEED